MEFEKKQESSRTPRIGLARDIDFIFAAKLLSGKLIVDETKKPIGVSWGAGFSIVWKESADKNNSKQLSFSDAIFNGSIGKVVSTRYITNWGLTIVNGTELILVHPPVEEGHTQGYTLNKRGIQRFSGQSFMFSDAIKATQKLAKQTS